MVAEPPGVGPCTDSDASGLALVGRAEYSNDIDNADGSGKGPFVYDEQVRVVGRAPDGSRHVYFGHLRVVDEDVSFESWFR
jgi:hypothetical protein